MPASHMDTISSSGCSASHPAPANELGKAVVMTVRPLKQASHKPDPRNTDSTPIDAKARGKFIAFANGPSQ